MKNIGWIFIFLCFSGCMGCEKTPTIDYVTLNVFPTQDTLYLGDTLALHVDFPSAVTLSDGTLVELQNGYFYIPEISVEGVSIDLGFYSSIRPPYSYKDSDYYIIPCQDGRCFQIFKMKLRQKGNFVIKVSPYHLYHYQSPNNYYKSNGKKAFNVYFSFLPFVPQKIATTGSVTYYPFTVVDRPSN